MINGLRPAYKTNKLIYRTYGSWWLTATIYSILFLKQARDGIQNGRRTEKSFIVVSARGAHGVQDLSCSKQSHTTNLAVGTRQLEI